MEKTNSQENTVPVPYKDRLPEHNVGYQFLDSAHFEDERGFVLGYNEKAQQYVTWQFTEENGLIRDFYFGHYITDKSTAEKDFNSRTQNRMLDYGLKCYSGSGMGITPDGSALPGHCYSVSETTGEVMHIAREEKGYWPVPGASDDRDFNRRYADLENRDMGVSIQQEKAMVVGSMFGWDVPAADPRHYDEKGIPKRPEKLHGEAVMKKPPSNNEQVR